MVMEVEVGWGGVETCWASLSIWEPNRVPLSHGVFPRRSGPRKADWDSGHSQCPVAPSQQARIAPRTNWALHCIKIFEFNESMGAYIVYYFNLKCFAFSIKANTY
jgi:hypothetical protein